MKTATAHKLVCTLKRASGGALAGFASFFVLNAYCKRTMPGCAPGQIDGQCGLATFMQVIYSAFGALIAWLIATSVITWYLWYRQAKIARGGWPTRDRR
jgi:hypothetical protein